MLKKIFFLTFFCSSLIVFAQCEINEEQGPMIADPLGAYDMHIIDNEVVTSLQAGYDTLTAFPNAVAGMMYETVVGVRIPNDTSFVYDLGTGPQLFEDVQINSIAINSVQGIPMGFSWECVGGPTTPSDCTWSGGDFGCIRFFSEDNVDGMLEGVYPLNVLLDVDATYAFLGQPIPITLTVEDLLNYYVLVITDDNNSTISEVLDTRKFDFITLSPNPVTDYFHIQYGNDKFELVDFSIYDILGNLVFSDSFDSKIGSNEISFDSFDLIPGIYTITLSNNKRLLTERMIVK